MGALLPNIDPIARAVIHFQFMHTLADGTTIAKITKPHPVSRPIIFVPNSPN